MGNRTSRVHSVVLHDDDETEKDPMPRTSTSTSKTSLSTLNPETSPENDFYVKHCNGRKKDPDQDASRDNSPEALYLSYLDVGVDSRLLEGSNKNKTFMSSSSSMRGKTKSILINIRRICEDKEHVASNASSMNVRVQPWCGTKFFSNLVLDALKSIEQRSPTFSKKSPFPPPLVCPLRHVSMLGSALPYPSIKNLPKLSTEGLLIQHWKTTIPNIRCQSSFLHGTPSKQDQIWLEKFHLESIARGMSRCNEIQMDQKVQNLKNNNSKTSNNYGHFVDTEKAVHKISAHFFIKPKREGEENIEIIWFGCSERYMYGEDSLEKEETCPCKSDYLIFQRNQDCLQTLLLPQVQQLGDSYSQNGLWGFCNLDGYQMDEGVCNRNDTEHHLLSFTNITPHIADSCSATMVGHLMYKRYGFEFGIFRQGSDGYVFPGTVKELLDLVHWYNQTELCVDITECQVVIFSVCDYFSFGTLVDIGVYGSSMHKIQCVLNKFAPKL